ncbi:hypothetical protein LINGRAHAP2_LOCUS2723 [Linum grandiflorum]
MAWVQLFDLPIEFYNPVDVHRIASSICKPIRVDSATKEGARGKYARVCVEVDLSKCLLPRYKVEGIPYLVVYEGLDKICTDCGMYRAEKSLCMCKKIPDVDVMATDTNKVQHEHEPQTESAFGGWMMGRKRRQKFQARVPPKKHLTQPPITQRQPTRFQSSNRFGALGENTTDDLLHVESNDKAHIDTLEGDLNARVTSGSRKMKVEKIVDISIREKTDNQSDPKVQPSATLDDMNLTKGVSSIVDLTSNDSLLSSDKQLKKNQTRINGGGSYDMLPRSNGTKFM